MRVVSVCELLATPSYYDIEPLPGVRGLFFSCSLRSVFNFPAPSFDADRYFVVSLVVDRRS